MGVPIFGFLFTEATSAGVEALGISIFVAASTLVEKGQNAFAWPGRKVAIERTVANPSVRKYWLDLMENKGVRFVGLKTKMA